MPEVIAATPVKALTEAEQANFNRIGEFLRSEHEVLPTPIKEIREPLPGVTAAAREAGEALAVVEGRAVSEVRTATELHAVQDADTLASKGAIREGSEVRTAQALQPIEDADTLAIKAAAKEAAEARAARDGQSIAGSDAREVNRGTALARMTQEERAATQAEARLTEERIARAARGEVTGPVLAADDAAARALAARVALGTAAVGAAVVLDKVAEVTAKPAISAPPEKIYLPNSEMIKAATVRKGEGPWQSAERILKADGKKHSIDEVRDLTKAIQAVYGSNTDNPSMAGLKVKHNFVKETSRTYNELVHTVKNEQVRALLIKFATAG